MKNHLTVLVLLGVALGASATAHLRLKGFPKMIPVCARGQRDNSDGGCPTHARNGGCANANKDHVAWRERCPESCRVCKYDAKAEVSRLEGELAAAKTEGGRYTEATQHAAVEAAVAAKTCDFTQATQDSAVAAKTCDFTQATQDSAVAAKTCDFTPAEEAAAKEAEDNPDALFNLCKSDSTPPTARVDELIAAGINLRYQDDRKYTALIYASYRGHTAAVEAIVAADPHPDHIRMTDGYGRTALIWAAYMGNTRIVEILIKADPSGDHLNMKGNGGNTALASAIHNDGNGKAGAAECAALLRAAGAQ